VHILTDQHEASALTYLQHARISHVHIWQVSRVAPVADTEDAVKQVAPRARVTVHTDLVKGQYVDLAYAQSKLKAFFEACKTVSGTVVDITSVPSLVLMAAEPVCRELGLRLVCHDSRSSRLVVVWNNHGQTRYRRYIIVSRNARATRHEERSDRT
jgi:hypothetical protein